MTPYCDIDSDNVDNKLMVVVMMMIPGEEKEGPHICMTWRENHFQTNSKFQEMFDPLTGLR